MTGVTDKNVSFSWDVPKDDGGCEITGYKVEKREASKRNWSHVRNTEELTCIADHLVEGQGYMFRVAAENEIGIGEFVELDRAATPKNQFGKY